MAPPISFSVVTPTFNRRQSLARLLSGLAEQNYPANDFEVILVDDGSTDDTVEFLEGLQTPFTLRVVEQSHGGPAQARNAGVACARGEIVLFLDDDVFPQPDLLTLHARCHRTTPGVVVIGPMLPPDPWPRPAWVRWEEEKLERQYQAMMSGLYRCTARQFYTANASLTRTLFLEVGGFDTGFTRAEDVELGYRLRDAGAQFVFEPRAGVLHFASRTFAAWRRTPYQYGRYDVIMGRDKRNEALRLAARDFQQRHRLGRVLAQVSAGRPRLGRAIVSVLGVGASVADRIGVYRGASAALSGIFHVLYWQGVCDELGGRAVFRRWLAHSTGALEGATR